MKNLRHFRFIIIFMILIVLIFNNCEKNNIKGIAIGKVSEINLCMSLPLYMVLEKPLMEQLYEEMFLPVRESIFTISYVDLDKLRILKKAKNLLFITNINRKNEYSKIINSFLNEKSIMEVKKDSVVMFNIFDGYADGQNILIIAGVDDQAIKAFILKHGMQIRDWKQK